MSRLPIRVRLTLGFALAMALVLAATGAFLYLRLQASLDDAIAESLEQRSLEVDVKVGRGESIEDLPVPPDEGFAQVFAPDGLLLDSTPNVAGAPVIGLEPTERALAAGAQTIESDDTDAFPGPVRMVARPVTDADGEEVVAVVGASLEDRNETLSGFLTELLLIGLAALVLASLLGFALATAALQPVESMRAGAAAITAAEPGRRLPLPRSRDEIRRLGETLNAMLARLEAALERERGFVADASHELRTPLALLKTELELALRHPRSADEQEEALRSAADETDRLVRLAEDLLVLARSDQGRLPLRVEAVSASRLLARVAGRFGEPIRVSAPDGLEVVGDEARLEQALGNLVDNALRHGAGPVQLSAGAANGVVELHVLDEGPGFPPEFLPRAFERFSRPDEARSGQGAGLGLALAQAIAAAHGGSAGAANRSTRGADVWLVIPTPAGPESPGRPR
jgi:two-component system, OmpR family, sensor kinase